MIKLTTNTITGTTQIYNIPPKPPQNSAFIRPFLVFNNDTDVNDLEWMKFWNKDNEVRPTFYNEGPVSAGSSADKDYLSIWRIICTTINVKDIIVSGELSVSTNIDAQDIYVSNSITTQQKD